MHFVTPAYLNSIFPSALDESESPTSQTHVGVVYGAEKRYASCFGPVQSWGYNVITPLEGIYRQGGMWNRLDLDGVDRGFVKHIFTQLKSGNDTEWDVLNLAFEAATSVKRCLHFDSIPSNANPSASVP
jgi:hypothetical protein